MSQISMPMRILLIGAAVFLVAWFTVLKPGGAEEELPAAQPANATQPATTAATPAASETTENTPVADVAVPADVLAKLPKGVAGALKERKTIVLGVFADESSNWRPMADDDRYVRNALKKTNRYDGEVFAKHISLSQLSKYGPLVNDLGVNQSPAVVVIDRNLKGTVLTGYVDRIAINQAIADARRDSIDPAITDEYLRTLNGICGRFNVLESRFSFPTVRGKKARLAMIDRAAKLDRQWITAVDKAAAPARWKSLKSHYLRVLRADLAGVKELRRQVAGGKALPSSIAELIDLEDARKLDRRFDEAGVTGCVINRRS